MGLLKTTNATPGRRIFVDDRTVGQTPEAVLVKCGPRLVKLGSSGRARPVAVPCGGELTVER
jgi:serine/threonine-protein kinase